MTETADSDDTDLLARSTAEALQWCVHCDSCAKKWCGGGGIEVVWELDGEFALDARVIGVAALGDGSLAVFEFYDVLVGPTHPVAALRLESALTEVALVAAESLRADSHAVADSVSRVGAGADDGTDDLVADTVDES